MDIAVKLYVYADLTRMHLVSIKRFSKDGGPMSYFGHNNRFA